MEISEESRRPPRKRQTQINTNSTNSKEKNFRVKDKIKKRCPRITLIEQREKEEWNADLHGKN